ncbi:MAG: PAS domain S-box protein [Chloroflexota bacterium]
MRVLIVDDYEQNLYLLRVLLEGNGYRVETAVNGAEALEAARRDPPAIVIADILMPVMDGFTLCREWQKDERLRGIPFVFYTATYTDSKDEEFALSLGAERFIVKPQEPEVFVGILRQVLQEAEAGCLRAPGKVLEEEAIYFKTYNERLVKKLEDKMLELERAHCRLSALYQASTELAAVRPLDELVPYILRTVVEAMGFDNASYFDYDPEPQKFRLTEAVGFPAEMVAAFRRELVFCLGEERGLVGLVGQTREPLIVADTREEPRWVPLDGTTRAALFVPVMHKDDLLGVANFFSTKPGHFGPDDARNVMILANNVGIAVENARLVERLSQSEARYRRLAENAPDLIYRYRLSPTPGFEYVSPAATAITGYTPEEHYADPELGLKLVHPDDQPLLEAYFQGEGVFGEPLTLRWVRKDGAIIWTEQRNVPIYDEAGNLAALEGIARDVTGRKQAEEALQESRERFRELFEGIPASCWTFDPTGTILDWNRASEELYGWSAQEAVGKTMFELMVIEENAARTRENIAQVFQGQALQGLEFQDRRADGTTCHMLVSQYPIRDAGGQVVMGICAQLNITERVQAEIALEKAAAEWQTTFDATTDGIYLLDREQRILRVNKAWTQMTGIGAEEALGRPCWEVMHKTQEPIPNCPLMLVVQSGRREAVERQVGERWFEFAVDPIFDESSEMIGAVHLMRDITGRKQSEEERERLLAQVREQAQQVQQIVSTVPEGVILLDADLRILVVNPTARVFLDALTDARWGEQLVHLGGRPLAELLTSPAPGLWHEIEIAGPPRRTFDVIARPMEEASENWGWVLVIRDVTEQREVQQYLQQQDRLAAVGQLAAGIAHDFNNIMAVIVLYTQMALREAELAAKTRERLETVATQAKRATDLIQQILDFSRRAVLERRPMDLAPFMKELAKLLERTLPEDVRVDLGCGADEYIVNADPTRLQQAVMNLAVNARDAMPAGGRLRIELDRVRVAHRKQAPLPEMEAGEWVRLRVSDTGTGIPPDVLAHIFEPFFTTKAPGQGSGLGLAQVWGIVQQHEGHIDVNTQAGHGATFSIYLPALLATQVAAEPPIMETVRGQGELLLVVEDNIATREALTDSLEMLGYRVVTAANGREALAVLEAHLEEITLVLSDLVMPEMGGQALLNAMKERGLAVPLVMLTGHPRAEELERLRAEGLHGWLSKPPSLERLAEVVARAVRA